MIVLVATGIYFSKLLRNTRDREAHAAAGVDPCYTYSARLWSDCLANAFHDFIRRNQVEGIEQRNLAPGRAAASGRESNRLVMHVVVVRRRHDFIAFAQRQSVVEKSEAGCGILSKCDVLRIATDVVGEGTADLQRNILVSWFEKCAINGNKGIGIALFPVLLDCLAHRPGVRR